MRTAITLRNGQRKLKVKIVKMVEKKDTYIGEY